ncbi:MAG: hypothetical protein M3R62_11910 [Acidobacteriota bacterium]|nr:hypothetical protein [Acidobacteriota bacterium]
METRAPYGSNSRRYLTTIGIAILLTLLVVLATWPPGMHIDLFEYGHWLGPVAGMLSGRIPYRDIFPIHGFLADGGLDFFVFRLTGPSFATSIWVRQAIGSLFQPAIFLVAVAVTRRPLLAAAMIPLGLPFASGLVFDRAVLPLLGLAIFLYALDARRRPGPAAVAGVLGVLGVFYSLDFGAFVLAAELLCVVGLWLFERNHEVKLFAVKAYVAGVAGASLSAGIALLLVGALGDFLEVSFIDLPLSIGSIWALKFPLPWEILAAWMRGRDFMAFGTPPIGLAQALRLYAVPLTTVAALVLIGRAAPRAERATLWRAVVLVLANAFWFRYVCGRFHYEAGNALAIPTLLGAATVSGTSGYFRRFDRFLTGTLAVIAALALGGLHLGAGVLQSAARFTQRLSSCPGCVRLNVLRAGGPRVPADEAARLVRLCAAVERLAPTGPILDLSNRPALYFFLDRVNPTRFYQVPIMEPFQAEVIHDLQRNPPSLVILRSGTALDSLDGRRNSDRIPRVWAYITARYTRSESVDGNVFALPPAPGLDSPRTR